MTKKRETMLLDEFRTALVGLPVSDVWRDYGSAIFLQFGELHSRTIRRRDGSPVTRQGDITYMQGEITLMIEWSWRIERPRSILGGSWSDERRWPGMFKKLLGAIVEDVQLIGRLHEIEVSLSNGLRVVSFMTAESQPAWALISQVNPRGSLHVRRGKLQFESPSAQAPV